MAGIHSGHRARMRMRVRKEGLKSFQPHEVLEIMLMQIIPRTDVNPLGHRLIDRFGSVYNTLTASEEELMEVSGIGKRSAEFLRAAGEAALAYSECWQSGQEIVSTSRQAIDVIRRMPTPAPGTYMLVCLDNANRIQHIGYLSRNSNRQQVMREMVRTALLHHAAQVFSVAFDTDDDFSPEESLFANRVGDLFKLVEILHLDHILCSPKGCLSARREGVITQRSIEDAVAAESDTPPPEPRRKPRKKPTK